MNIEECKEFLVDSMMVEEIVSNYIQNLENTKNFAGSFISGFTRDGKDFSFDFAEILDCDNIDIVNLELTENIFYLKFEFNYILTIWKREIKKQLARITACVEGECTFENKEGIDIDVWEKLSRAECIKWTEDVLKFNIIKLNNIDEEYDDTSILL